MNDLAAHLNTLFMGKSQAAHVKLFGIQGLMSGTYRCIFCLVCSAFAGLDKLAAVCTLSLLDHPDSHQMVGQVTSVFLISMLMIFYQDFFLCIVLSFMVGVARSSFAKQIG